MAISSPKKTSQTSPQSITDLGDSIASRIENSLHSQYNPSILTLNGDVDPTLVSVTHYIPNCTVPQAVSLFLDRVWLGGGGLGRPRVLEGPENVGVLNLNQKLSANGNGTTGIVQRKQNSTLNSQLSQRDQDHPFKGSLRKVAMSINEEILDVVDSGHLDSDSSKNSPSDFPPSTTIVYRVQSGPFPVDWHMGWVHFIVDQKSNGVLLVWRCRYIPMSFLRVLWLEWLLRAVVFWSYRIMVRSLV